MVAPSSTHPDFTFLPRHLLPLSARNGPSGKVGCDPERHNCSCPFLDLNPCWQGSSSLTRSSPFAWVERGSARAAAFLCSSAFLGLPCRALDGGRVLHAYASRAQTLPEKKRTRLTWLRSSRKLVAELQIKSRHFASWACVFTTTLFFLRACCLTGTRCSA